jgi:L-aminopeptidase/D-esterase-like protein
MSGSLTDIAGIRVGHAEDARALSGVTAILFDAPVTAAVDIRGGGPGTRETDLLDPERTVPGIDALVLSGGSVFGLDAASGVTAWLAQAGRGFAVGPARVPIVPAAILFDLLNGGDKGWGRSPPYRDLGYAAADGASAGPVAMGSVGAGLGARTANLKGGLGSASAPVEGTGARVAALVAVNALGRVTVGDGPHFWAAPFEVGDEFGGLGPAAPIPPEAFAWPSKPMPGANTTLAVVATDARLSKAEARRLAVMAQDGLARAIVPAHTPLDGDLVFAAATGAVALADPVGDLARLGDAAARVLARAVALGVHRATALPVAGAQAAWRDRFGG